MAKFTQHVYGGVAKASRPIDRRPLIEAIRGVHVVYYVKFSPTRIKIGTTGTLIERLYHLGKHRSDVMAIEFGSYALERERHQQFAHLRTEGSEMFRTGRDLLDHMAELRNLILV